jgi:lysozyme
VPRIRQRVRKQIQEVVRASALAILLAVSVASPAIAHPRHAEPHRHRHAVKGIDVSHFQGAIDWPAVARDHVAFAYIKASEGVESQDARFERNWRGAERAGIRVGAYHYFIFCRSGRAQAANFLAAAPRGAGALPPAVDLETPRSCHGRLAGPEMRRELSAYLAVVEARERRRAVLYVTPQFYRAYAHYLPQRPLWRRSIRARPGASWALWQYGSRGRVAGIRTYVDLNVSGGGGHALPL